MSLVLDHFRGHVLKGTTKSVSLLTVVRLHAPTEITDFDDVAFFYENVLWLDISVDQTLFVHVVDTWAYLNEKVEGSIFTQILLFSN